MVVIQCSPIAFAPPPFKGRRKPRMSQQQHATPITPHEVSTKLRANPIIPSLVVRCKYNALVTYPLRAILYRMIY